MVVVVVSVDPHAYASAYETGPSVVEAVGAVVVSKRYVFRIVRDVVVLVVVVNPSTICRLVVVVVVVVDAVAWH